MATAYISPSGAGALDGSTINDPVNWNSGAGLSTAETAAGTNGTIIFLDGTYPFGGTETFAGADGLTYESLNINGAFLGDSVIRTMILGSTSNSVTLKNFKTQNVRFRLADANATSKASTITGCYITHPLAQSYGTGSDAIKAWTTGGSAYHQVTNNVIELNVTTTGERLFYGTGYHLIGNTINITADASADGTASLAYYGPALMKNNIWVCDRDTFMRSTSTSNFMADIAANSSNSSFYQMGSINDTGGTDNLYDTDPQFVDSANGDYRLRPTSPCINAGTAS